MGLQSKKLSGTGGVGPGVLEALAGESPAPAAPTPPPQQQIDDFASVSK